MENEIVDSVWYGLKMPFMLMTQIGIVAIKCKPDGKVKFYIGLGRGEDQEEDEQMIADMGVPFYPKGLVKWFMGVTMESVVDDLEVSDKAKDELRTKIYSEVNEDE